jgi:hypothetical protein
LSAGLPLRRLRPEVERVEVLAEGGERPLPGERQVRAALVQRGAVLDVDRDVLAEAVEAAAGQPDVRRDALEAVREDGVQPLERDALDHERQIGDERPARRRRHQCPVEEKCM